MPRTYLGVHPRNTAPTIDERNTWVEKGRECRRFFDDKWNREHADQIYQALLGEYPAGEIGWQSDAYARHLGWDA